MYLGLPLQPQESKLTTQSSSAVKPSKSCKSSATEQFSRLLVYLIVQSCPSSHLLSLCLLLGSSRLGSSIF